MKRRRPVGAAGSDSTFSLPPSALAPRVRQNRTRRGRGAGRRLRRTIWRGPRTNKLLNFFRRWGRFLGRWSSFWFRWSQRRFRWSQFLRRWSNLFGRWSSLFVRGSSLLFRWGWLFVRRG